MGSIDADAHVVECETTFDFLEPEFEKYRPSVVRTKDRGVESSVGVVQREFWYLDNRMQPKEGNIGVNTTREAREMEDISRRLSHMDELGIDIQVLYPTLFLRPWTRNHEVEYALCRAYNRWLASIWKQAPERLKWVVMPSLLNMDTIKDELRFGKENGACGVYVHGIEHDTPLYSQRYFPLFEAAQSLELPICFHAGNNSFLLEDMYREDAGFAKAKLPVVASFHQLLLKGIPDMFPKLRWGYVEVSAQWIPYALNDLSIRLRRRGIDMSPTIMADNRMWVACQVTDDLDWVIKYAGETQIVVGTDYGHNDTSTEIQALRKLSNDGKVAPEVAAKILDSNARALYGL
ncbi:MAG: amidohydrolase family protein [Rhodospirillaceae bacterium]